MVSWRTWLFTAPGREGPSKISSPRDRVTWMPSKWAALGQVWQDEAPMEPHRAHTSQNSYSPSKTELCMGRRMPLGSHDMMRRKAVRLDMCDSNASCSLTPQHHSQAGSDRTADHSSRCPPGSDAQSGEKRKSCGAWPCRGLLAGKLRVRICHSLELHFND